MNLYDCKIGDIVSIKNREYYIIDAVLGVTKLLTRESFFLDGVYCFDEELDAHYDFYKSNIYTNIQQYIQPKILSELGDYILLRDIDSTCLNGLHLENNYTAMVFPPTFMELRKCFNILPNNASFFTCTFANPKAYQIIAKCGENLESRCVVGNKHPISVVVEVIDSAQCDLIEEARYDR